MNRQLYNRASNSTNIIANRNRDVNINEYKHKE